MPDVTWCPQTFDSFGYNSTYVLKFLQKTSYKTEERKAKDAVGLFCKWGLVHTCYDVITLHPRPIMNTCFIYSIRTYVTFKYSDITDARKSSLP